MAQRDLKKRLEVQLNTNQARNVIIFIGDGMGINTHTGARIYKGQKNGQSGEEASFAWENFPATGLFKTYSVDHQVPDSAATATAIFSGVKTRSDVLGIDSVPAFNACYPDLVEKHKLEGLLHKAVANGKATGIVTTDRITGGTPGSLYAHIQNRDWEADSDVPEHGKACPDVAKQMIYNDVCHSVNLFFGGGRSKFLKKEDGGERNDGEDLILTWMKMKEKEKSLDKSFSVLYDKKDLEEWSTSETDFVLGLFNDSAMPYELERDSNQVPSLEDMTRKAIQRLKKGPNGFFLMVESAGIDKAHHRNWPKKAFEETIMLEKSVQVALDLSDPQDTLIIVTADHSQSWTINGYPKRGNNILGYVYDVASKRYIKNYDGSFSPYSTITYSSGLGFKDHFTNDSQKAWEDLKTINYNDNNYRAPSMFLRKSATHGGEDVSLYAYGPWAHLLTGVHEQNYIAHAVIHASGWRSNNAAGSRTSKASFCVIFFCCVAIMYFIQ